jgi:hypothetical protein
MYIHTRLFLSFSVSRARVHTHTHTHTHTHFNHTDRLEQLVSAGTEIWRPVFVMITHDARGMLLY